jgi:hypothetical protein
MEQIMTTTSTQTTTAGNVRMRTSAALPVAATASVLAGFIHYIVMPEHLAEWWVYAAFFTAIGMFELIWAALVFTGRNRQVLLVGVLVNVAVLALWVVTRTTGLPIGPEPGTPEAVGIWDLASCAAETVTVLAVLYSLLGSKRTHHD